MTQHFIFKGLIKMISVTIHSIFSRIVPTMYALGHECLIISHSLVEKGCIQKTYSFYRSSSITWQERDRSELTQGGIQRENLISSVTFMAGKTPKVSLVSRRRYRSAGRLDQKKTDITFLINECNFIQKKEKVIPWASVGICKDRALRIAKASQEYRLYVQFVMVCSQFYFRLSF